MASQFKFLQMRASHPSCQKINLETWITRVVGCPMFILQNKLQILKAKLKECNKSTFRNVHDNVKVAEVNQCIIQKDI